MADTVDTAIYRLRVEGEDSIRAATKAIEEMVTAEQDATKSNRTLTQQIQRGLAQYDPVIKAQQQYAKQLELNARARESGAASEQELAAHQEMITQNYQRQVTAINAVEKATGSNTSVTKLGRYELINLGRQLQDVVVSLQGGQGFGTVMLQQGSQISDVFTSTTATLAGMKTQLAGFATAAAGYLAPLAAGGAMGGFSAVAIAAAVNWKNAQGDIVRALAGIGRQSGTTIDDINRIGFATAKTTDLSIGAARELATSLAATGKITKENLQPATAAAEQLAKALGIDATDAAKMLGTALVDPTKGVEELNAKTGGFNVTTREQIALAMRMGDVGQAQAIMLRSLGVATVNAAKANESWTDSFKDAWTWIKNITGAMGEMTVRGAEITRQQLGGARPTIGVSTATQLTQARGELAGAQTQLAGIDPVIAEAMAGTVDKLKQNIAKLTAEVERLKATQFGEDLTAWNAQLDRAANAAGNATRAMIPEIDAIEKTKGAISDLTRAINMPDVGRGSQISKEYENARVAAQNLLRTQEETKASSERYQQQLAEVGKEWSNISLKAAQAADAAKIQLPVLEAVGGAEKMAAQYAADYTTAKRSGASADEATQVAMDKQRATQAQINAGAKETLFSLENQAAAVTAVTGQQQILAQAEATYNQLLHDNVNAILAEEIALRGAANAQAAATANVEKQVKSLNESTEMIKAQKNGTDKNVAAMQAYNHAIESGADAGAAASVYAATLANETAKAASNTEKMGRDTATVVGNIKMMVDALGNVKFITPTGESLLAAITARGGEITTDQASADAAKADLARRTQYGGFDPRVMGRETMSFAADPSLSVAYRGGAATNRLDVGIRNAAFSGGATFGTSAFGGAAELSAEEWLKAAHSSTDLKNSVDKLTKSTDSLNRTNQELLSPFYTQDPRTSHIGFRSQGMASGGYIDVPGSPSMNDNMTAIIPVASGERIYVDPMASKRGSTGGTVINISAPMTFHGPADRDEVGRTVYQNMQVAARSMQAAQR